MGNIFLSGLLVLNLLFVGCSTISSASELEREKRIAVSPQWNGERFQNPERVPDVEFWPSLKMFWSYFLSKPEGYIPSPPLPTEPFKPSQWGGQRDSKFSWLGHTTFLIQLDDKIILTDPIFTQQAGSFGWLSPKRYSETLASTDILPFIDVVLITHNHLDHLDENSIKSLIPKTKFFVVPLSVGELLEEWGIPRNNIIELDWWQFYSIDDLTITAAPAKHTSERGMFDKNKTLWASYGIRGKKQNFYLSGDSGWHEGLYEIGKRLGPFDVAFFEIGAYSNLKGQMEVHYTPEQAVKGLQAVRGKLVVPSGWGTFDLGLFPWYEPIERFVIASEQAGVYFLTPMFGEVVTPGNVGSRKAWWKLFKN